ncbi:MAG: hypothetical protein U1F36_10370 [Planctomycetota bacterium]
MRILCAQLQREYREQRFALRAALAILVLAGLGGNIAVHTAGLNVEWLRSGLAFVGALLFVALIATDLLSGDAARGTREFLQRTPRGLRSAFLGKLGFAIVAAPLLPVCAVACGGLLLHATGIATAPGLPLCIDGFVIGVAIVLALWVFACAAFVRRGILALPLALLCLAPIVALCVVTAYPWWDGRIVPLRSGHLMDPRLVFGVLCAVAVLVAAGAFLRGPRRGFAVLAPGLASLMVLGSVDWYRQMHPTPEQFELYAWGSRIDKAAHRVALFASARGNARQWVVTIDLDRGTIADFEPADATLRDTMALGPQSILALDGGRRAIVAWSSLRIESPNAPSMDFAFRDQVARICGLGVQIAGADGAQLPPTQRRWCSTIDLGRGRHFADPLLPPGGCQVLGREWLISTTVQSGSQYVDWKLFDPDTGVSRAAPWMQDFDRVIARLIDGRLLIGRPTGTTPRRVWENDRTLLVDPALGTTTAVQLERGDSIQQASLSFGSTSLQGRDWLQGRQSHLYSIGPGEPVFRLDAPSRTEILGELDDTHLLLLDADQRTLTSLRSSDGHSELLYPR